jgi:FkbM family methyltransferase
MHWDDQGRRRNLEANGIRDYSLLACAVGGEAGLGRMVAPPGGFEKDTGRGEVAVFGDKGHGTHDSDVVPISTLDCAVRDLEPQLRDRAITFVKLDVEGMELDALRGATTLLDNHRPQLAIEANTAAAQAGVGSFLADFGYQCVRQFTGTPTYYYIHPRCHQLRGDQWAAEDLEAHWVRTVAEHIESLVAPADSFILVDEDRLGKKVAAGRHRIPFLERDGQYWGKPADDQTAIRELERLRQAGANFIVFTWPAFWWLEYYAEFHHCLRTQFKCVLENDRLVVFDLRT